VSPLPWRSSKHTHTPGGAVGYPAQPRLIRPPVRQSLSKITFNYSAENGLGPTDLVNKYVKMVNQRGIVSQIFFKINLYLMILAKIRVNCILYYQ
jgi:hypothetical protein